MNKIILFKFAFALLVVSLFCTRAELKSNEATVANTRFEISFPAAVSKEPLDGRLLLLISTSNNDEPRLQISEDLSTQQVFGVDVDSWKPDQPKTVDGSAFGYPLRSLDQLKPGEYWVQALLHRYETFHRAD